jgi:hypothetical protein
MVASNIDPHLAEQLISQAIIRNFDSSDRITIPYDHPRSVPFVTAGTVKVFYQLSSGEELLLYYLEPSQYCVLPRIPISASGNLLEVGKHCLLLLTLPSNVAALHKKLCTWQPMRSADVAY